MTTTASPRTNWAGNIAFAAPDFYRPASLGTAVGPDDYVRCTLTAQPGGELEFTRCVVTGGAAQSGVRAAQRHAARPRAAMTVRTEVSGNTFAVSIGGKTIDTWTDDRLPIGGIGFIGAPDDRARLYWVRLSSTGSLGKE